MRILSLRPTIALLTCLLTATAQALDVDGGMDAIRLAQSLKNPQVSGFLASVSQSENRGQAPGEQQFTTASPQPLVGGWARLRGIDLSKVQETREALLKLRAEGIKTCVFLRRSVTDWKVSYLPADLSEAYEHGRKLGATYGDLVDAWEVDNEPDLGFVPESAERYTAFLKAMYLGLQRGFAEGQQRVASSEQRVGLSKTPRGALVIMGSLGLPPGPWLERFAANDGFAYTDGFNYHYYGYAEDFTGVYRQHERAVAELTTARSKPETGNLKPEGSGSDPATQVSGQTATPQVSGFRSQVSPASVQKSLPIFLTEVGYGMLGKQARDTKEGRLRQWRWFKSVGEQIAALQPEAPMAFYLPPYLEYDTSEYGLTVPPGGAVKLSDEGSPLLGKSGKSWIAGGIKYTAEDFAEVGRVVPNAPSASDPGGLGIIRPTPEDWMNLIGKEIGGNQVTPALAQWMAARRGQLSDQSYRLPGSAPNNRNHSWQIATTVPSPIVIDFLPGEGLSHIKRYNGLFVVGKSPEVGRVAPNAPPEPPKSKTLEPKPETPIPRSEEFILQVRTQNGNLYEVYPTRQATPDWQRFLEPGDNFTMAFYGRAALPWRFKDNKPASLVVVMYPKQLPATYEFRRPQLLKFGANQVEVGRVVPNAPKIPEHGGLGIIRPTTDQVANLRYGQGKVVLYNFSDKPVTGRLELPSALSSMPLPSDPSANSAPSALTLAPGERREIPVSIKVPWDRYERIPVEITFVPIADNPQISLSAVGPAKEEGLLASVSQSENRGQAPGGQQPTTASSQVSDSPVSRFRTDLLPDIGGMPATAVSALLPQHGARSMELGANHKLAANRLRVSEEAPMVEQTAERKERNVIINLSDPLASSSASLTVFAQQAAKVEQTEDSFTITVTSIPAGKPQRIEVEIPWPDGLGFESEEFLSLEFRLGGTR